MPVCDTPDCKSRGICIPCDCKGRFLCDDCTICEAYEHWKSCTGVGCQCDPEKIYVCKCGKPLTLVWKKTRFDVVGYLQRKLRMVPVRFIANFVTAFIVIHGTALYILTATVQHNLFALQSLFACFPLFRLLVGFELANPSPYEHVRKVEFLTDLMLMVVHAIIIFIVMPILIATGEASADCLSTLSIYFVAAVLSVFVRRDALIDTATTKMVLRVDPAIPRS